MSLDSDLLFTPSDTLLISDFGNLTEFDDFQKDLFLSNAMKGMADATFLELECKDNLKLIADVGNVDEAVTASLKTDEAVMDSVTAQDSVLAMFMDTETSDSLRLVDLTLQHQCTADSDGIGIPNMDMIHAFDSRPGLTTEDGLHAAILAATELNCMSLDDLDLSIESSPDTLCTSSSSQSLSPTVSLVMNISEPAPSRVPSSPPLGNAVASCSVLKLEGQPFCSTDMVSPPIQTIHMSQGQMASAPSMQRSQSSNALGQLRASHSLGSQANDFNFQPICKQEVPLLGPSNGICPPYQALSMQGLTALSAGLPIRRVYSTGDLQGLNGMQSFYGMKVERTIPEEASRLKIGHYTREERRMRLHRYRQKRTERNFSKKIKYACRKTLADNRARVRGRFARSDEIGDSSFRGSDLPLIDEYEEVTSHHPTSHHTRMVREQQEFYMANNSCVMSSNSIAQFWNTVGMKVVM